MEQTVVDEFVVLNDKGIHARPSAEIVKCVAASKSKVTLHMGQLKANGKSILDLLALSAGCGSRIRVEAVGPDAEQVVAEILELARDMFGVYY